MSDLEKYERVNRCETLAELQKCILDFADENEEIQGRTRNFDAKKMSALAEVYFQYPESTPPNVVTREFGLRQQLMYIRYYS